MIKETAMLLICRSCGFICDDTHVNDVYTPECPECDCEMIEYTTD